jgi:type IV pilus assembly protein PilZ
MTRRLRLTLHDARALREEYRRNMANGGAFVPTEEAFELREVVEVELHLPSCGELLVEEAEVVYRAAAGETAGGGAPGVAVQFLADPGEVRARLERLLAAAEAGEAGQAAAEDPSVRDLAPESEERPSSGGAGASDDPLAAVSDRREASRAPARVLARVTAGHATFEGLTRDLSETGVLISMDASGLPLGKAVRLELTHASSGERLALAGTVSRHVQGEGAAVAVALRFEPDAAEAHRIAAFVAGVKQSEVERMIGGISGVIEELGMQNLLQMLCKSSPAGTLTVARGGEEGVIAFEHGMLRYVRLAGLPAGKALMRLLSWERGTFSFHAQVDSLEEEDVPVSVDAALLDALRRLDEARRAADRAAPSPAATFRVDHEALAGESGASKTEEAVLDLAAAGFTLRRILDVIPEPDAEILAALQSLEDRGILLRR